MASERILLLAWPVTADCACDADSLFVPPDYPLFVSDTVVVALAAIAHEVPTFHRIGFALEWIHCSNLRQSLGEWPVVIARHAVGHRHFAPLVLHNAHHAEHFRAEFPNHTFVRSALWFLFRVGPAVLREMRSGALNGSRCDFGMHVRTQYMPEEYDDAVTLFARAFESVGEAALGRGSVGLLASDTPEIATKLNALLRGADLHWSRAAVPRQQAQACGDLQRALAEMHALSECRFLFGTRESTFSTAAAAMMSDGGRFFSVCFSRDRCRQFTVVPRSPQHGLCYWEWVHSRNFACRSPDWELLERECCSDGLCGACWYHRAGLLSWASELPFWRPQDVLTACLVGSLVARVVFGAGLRALGVLALGWGVLLFLSVNYTARGNMLTFG